MKSMKKRSTSLLIFLFLILFSIFLLIVSIRTNIFLSYFEDFIEDKTGMVVDIGKVDISRGVSSIYIYDIEISNEKEGFSLYTPLILIKGNLRMFIHREIDYIEIEKPVVRLDLQKRSMKLKRKNKKTTLPVLVNSGVTQNATLILIDSKGGINEIKAKRLSLKKIDKDYSRIDGKFLISTMSSPVKVKVVVNHKRPSIKELEVDADEIRIPDEKPINIDKFKISGQVSGLVKVLLDDTLIAGLNIEFKDILIRSSNHKDYIQLPLLFIKGRIKENPKDERINYNIESRFDIITDKLSSKISNSLLIAGNYSNSEDTLIIQRGSFKINRSHMFSFTGNIFNLRSKNPLLDIALNGKSLSLPWIKNMYFLYKGQQAPLKIKGWLNIDAKVKGSLSEGIGLKVDSEVTDLIITKDSNRIKLTEKMVRILLDGTYHFKQDTMSLKVFKLDIKDLAGIRVNGEVRDIKRGSPQLNSSLRLYFYDTEALASSVTLNSPFYKNIPMIKGKGTVDLIIKGNIMSPEIKGNIVSSIDLIKGRWYEARFTNINTSFHFKNRLPGIDKADIKIKTVCLTERPLNRKDRYYTAEGVNIMINDLKVSDDILKGSLQIALNDLAIAKDKDVFFKDEDIMLAGSLLGSMDKKSLKLNSFRFVSKNIKELVANVSLKDRSMSILINGDIDYSFDLEHGLPNRALSWIREKGIDVRGQGRTDADFTVNIKNRQVSDFDLKTDFKLRDVSFNNKTETVIAEGIDIDGVVMILSKGDTDVIGMEMNLETKNFELLAGNIYGNFSNRPVIFQFHGEYNKKEDVLNLKDITTEIEGLVKTVIGGKMESPFKEPFFNLHGNIKDINIKTIFDDYLRDAYAERFSILNNFKIEGLSELDIHIIGLIDKPDIYTHLKVKDLNIVKDERDGVYGVSLDLPLCFGVRCYEDYGMLRVKGVSISDIKIPEIDIPLLIKGDSILLQKPIEIKLLGGELFIENTELRGLAGSDRMLHATLRLQDIDLLKLSKKLSIPEFEGTLMATVPDLVFTEKNIYTDGEVLINAFDGTVRIENFAVKNILTPVMSVESDINIDDLNLSMVTETFETGHISGILKGYVKDLIIVNGQPQHFIASFETVRKKGVPQKISVKALKKIQILGSGRGGSILDRGIYRFFKEYRYTKIGFRAYLKNDTLQLEGIEKSNGKGYLVKGGFFPPKVDVINYTQRISFKELVERLKRIKR